MKPIEDLTRRKLLALGGGSVGALGVLSLVDRAAADQVEYNQTTFVEGEGPDLRVDWVEMYNGGVLESQSPPTSRGSSAQPLISLSNVMPGDSGRASFGLRTTAGPDTDESSDPVRIQMRLRQLAIDTENGLTEPERKAGDTSPDEGELGEHLQTRVWYDSGIEVGDTPLYGHCDGAFNAGDELIVEGAFDAVALDPGAESWTTIDATPDGTGECLQAGQALCVSLEWSLPDAVGNRLQGDAVGFAVEFRPISCE